MGGGGYEIHGEVEASGKLWRRDTLVLLLNSFYDVITTVHDKYLISFKELSVWVEDIIGKPCSD